MKTALCVQCCPRRRGSSAGRHDAHSTVSVSAILIAGDGLPAEHWRHLRTTNPIESSFATVKLRTKVTKGAGSKKAALAMAYELLDAPHERWRRVNGRELIADVLAGMKFKDGIKVTDDDNETTDEKVAA